VPESRARAPLPPHGGALAVPAGVGQQLVSAPGDLLRRPLEQLGRERLELGDQDAEHVGAVAAQALRPQARLVAELVNDLLDALHGCLGNAVAAVDDLRHGRDRDAGSTCHIRHLDALLKHHVDDDRAPPAARRQRLENVIDTD
jgi:hypothetical protein